MNRALARAHSLAEKFRAERGGKSAAIWARATPQAPAGELRIYELIGSDFFGEGITGKSVAEALDNLKGVSDLSVRINSEGGDVFEAAAIFTQLRNFPAKKTVYVDGIAASAASYVAMVGDRIVMSPVATVMVHNPWTIALGEAVDLRAVADRLDLEAQIIAETYAAQTGKPSADMRKLMDAETWLDAKGALAAGFVDEISAAPNEESDDEENQDSAKLSRLLNIAARQRERVSTADVLSAKATLHNLRSLHAGVPAIRKASLAQPK